MLTTDNFQPGSRADVLVDLVVRLSAAEWQAAASIGEKRETLRVQRGKSPAEYRDRGGTHVERNRIGSVAEYALAKHYGKDTLQDWCETKSYSEHHHLIPCDVGTNLHVRATANPRGRLVGHPYDPDSGIFVLARVDATARTVTFVGWTTGATLKEPYNWCNTGPGFGLRPAFVIATNELQPISTIPPEAIHGS